MIIVNISSERDFEAAFVAPRRLNSWGLEDVQYARLPTEAEWEFAEQAAAS
jgi:formylglycine-generating enzyme required for sulfatase activity